MFNEQRRQEALFPHDEVRPIQDELVISIQRSLEKKKHLIVHAPTGLGKTAASLGPAISKALKDDLTVFFLTSRHTQHKIALDTVKEIEKRYDITIPVANLIGKKHMCLQPGADKLYSGEFVEYCKKLREDGKCSFYENMKKSGSLSIDARRAVERAIREPSSQSLKIIGQDCHVCPYEIGILAAQKAKVIVTDYFYIFNPIIRDTFFAKIGKSMDKCIIVVDEAHNLPDRVKDLATVRTSTRIVERAQQEAEKYDVELPELGAIKAALIALSKDVDKDNERYVEKTDFTKLLPRIDAKALLKLGDNIREDQQRSYIASVAEFLLNWEKSSEGFTRILNRADDNVVLSYRCLDPGVIVGPVVQESYVTILMSGTLTPTVMYAELLDIPLNAEDYTFKSPFPDEHRLTLVVPQTTTKYQSRGEEMYTSQGRILARAVNAVPGNSIVFFPSYYLRDQVAQHFEPLCGKTIFKEERGMGKGQREELLKRFGQYKDTGAVILGVMSGSFAEGVDYPGDLLKAVFVIGLPLARPDKETKALIDYYNEKFNRGWDYGYVFPAFNKILQSAGRAIRSETDRGVLCFIDERYAWNSYQRCFPPHWDLKMSGMPEREIAQFFGVKLDSIDVPKDNERPLGQQSLFTGANDL